MGGGNDIVALRRPRDSRQRLGGVAVEAGDDSEHPVIVGRGRPIMNGDKLAQNPAQCTPDRTGTF